MIGWGRQMMCVMCVAGLATLGACGGGDDQQAEVDAGAVAPDATPTFSDIGPVPPSPQRDGDVQVGYDMLLNGGYVGCGVPYTAYAAAFPPAPDWQKIAGRPGRNADLPYNYTAFTTPRGVEVVTPNCLQCHADYLNGELVIGLGNARADYTQDPTLPAQLAGGLLTDPDERAEWEKWKDRVVTIGPYTVTENIGVNPADNLAAILFAHRDQETLEWHDEPLLEEPPDIVVPVDVPPWWRMKKKNSMFYTSAGRGDHARIMMTASTLCIDSVEEAEAIDAYFPDIRSYILSLDAPPYPYSVDTELAADGKDVFAATCAECHGTYEEGDVYYPNLVVSTEEVGTDGILALGASQFADRFVDWFNGSFFGELAYLAPAPGYTAPPLDGIWATAPFLHNGSVPTIATLLESDTRPMYWTRNFNSDSDFDEDELGWNFTALDEGHDTVSDPGQRVLIYDTTKLGYGNEGHTFGDELTDAERTAVIEYLKTL
jgi:hypothetical protein